MILHLLLNHHQILLSIPLFILNPLEFLIYKAATQSCKARRHHKKKEAVKTAIFILRDGGWVHYLLPALLFC